MAGAVKILPSGAIRFGIPLEKESGLSPFLPPPPPIPGPEFLMIKEETDQKHVFEWRQA